MKHTVTAIIYNKKGRVISIGQNSYIKTHPLQAIHANKVGESNKIYLHAEVSAIAKCKDIQKAYKIVVMRYNKQGEPVIAKPCNICLSAIHSTPIKIIEHT
jgi:tRNA(Arg) A34 adenosine deaminase TadA